MKVLFLAWLPLLLSSKAFGFSVKYQINQNVLDHSTTETTIDSTSISTTTVETMGTGLEFALFLDQVVVYLYPANSGTVGLGYAVTPDLEIGISIGLNSHKRDRPKNESHSQEYGVNATYVVPMGNADIELLADFTSGTSKTETVENGSSKTNVSSTGTSIGMTYVRPLGDTVSYLFGLTIATVAAKDHETDLWTKSKSMSVNLAGIRMDF